MRSLFVGAPERGWFAINAEAPEVVSDMKKITELGEAEGQAHLG